MPKLKDLISRHSLVIDFAKSLIPEFARFDLYLSERRKILDQPRAVLTSKIKSTLAYACFCLVAPIAATYLTIGILQTAHIIPPSQIEKSIADMNDLEARSIAALARVDPFCQRAYANSFELIEACKSSLRQQIADGRSDVRAMQGMLDRSQRFANLIHSQVFIIQPLLLILNAYIFAIFWARAFPVHATANAADRSAIRRAYLLTLGTTLFIPGIFASSAMLAAEIVERTTPESLFSFAPIISMLGLLPLFAALIITAQRLHRLLNKADDWRIGRPVSLMLMSNAVTCLLALPVILLLLAVV